MLPKILEVRCGCTRLEPCDHFGAARLLTLTVPEYVTVSELGPSSC